MLLTVSRQAAVLACAAAFAPIASAQLGTPLQTFTAQAAEDNFGTSVAVAGDVNGDGVSDYIVGAYLNNTVDADAGQVRVFSGSDGSVLHTFDGDAAGDQLGFSVAGAGDLNGDGHADIIAGADVGDYARVWSGADGSELYTFIADTPGDLFGSAVAGAGDVNLDGRADVLVGAPGADATLSDVGFVRLYSGLDGSTLRTWFGRTSGTGLGRAVASAGFVDADGVPDVIAGGNNGSNVALVFSGAGGATIHTLFGDSGLDWFGTSVAGVGDANGDGFGDVLVGAPQGFLGPGYARLFSGATGSLLRQHDGQNTLDLFGWSVTGLGDVNGDGRSDYAIGAPFADNGGLFNTGRVRAFSGADGTQLFDRLGDSDDELLGWSVSGDACTNVIAGAPVARDGGEAKVLDSGQSGVCGIVSFRPTPRGPLIPLPTRTLR